MQNLESATLSYLHATLGIELLSLQPWERSKELPYFLNDTFNFEQLTLLGQPIVLAICRNDTKKSLSEVRTWMNTVGRLANNRAVYVTQTMESYERRRLIELKVPFIVPGNQLYLPDLGLDLREYFREPALPQGTTLSPSTQAMVITALLNSYRAWLPSYTAEALGYSAMTLSRATKELVATGLAKVGFVGPFRGLMTELPPEQVWEQLKPLLRTPVKRSVWVETNQGNIHRPNRLAGLSALAHHSMLTAPTIPVYALTTVQWNLALAAGAQIRPEPTESTQEWQVWSYTPELVPDALCVDPLSLALSLQAHPDERVQLSLNELKTKFPWSQA